jgi:hypothetical protein
MAKAWDSAGYSTCTFKHVFFDDPSTEDATGALAPPAAQVRGKGGFYMLIRSGDIATAGREGVGFHGLSLVLLQARIFR